jgi:hypothetical protein
MDIFLMAKTRFLPGKHKNQGQTTVYCVIGAEKHLFSEEKQSNNFTKWSRDHMETKACNCPVRRREPRKTKKRRRNIWFLCNFFGENETF